MDYLKMKRVLDDNNVTHEEMDSIWEQLKVSNRIVKNLSEHGKKWYDLPEHLIIDAIKRSKLSEAGEL